MAEGPTSVTAKEAALAWADFKLGLDAAITASTKGEDAGKALEAVARGKA